MQNKWDIFINWLNSFAYDNEYFKYTKKRPSDFFFSCKRLAEGEKFQIFQIFSFKRFEGVSK